MKQLPRETLKEAVIAAGYVEAYRYNVDGVRQQGNEVDADDKGMHTIYLESGDYILKFFDPNILPPDPPPEVAEPKRVKIESRTFNVRDSAHEDLRGSLFENSIS